MVDIHCHILPGLDDGAETEKQALAMCAIAAHDGIKTIVATPHTGNGVYSITARDVRSGVERLNKLLKGKGIALTILPGHDAHIQSTLIEDIKQGKVLTINDAKRYIILELPVHSVPSYVKEVITKLKSNGITGIISHPERNIQIQKDTRALKRLVTAGALTQITALSLTGGFGEVAGDTAVTLLKQGLAHIIATDAHSVDKRPPVLSEAVKEAGRIIGERNAWDMANTIPLEIIS